MQLYSTSRSRPGVLIGMAVLVALLSIGSTPAVAQGPTDLQLINGWYSGPYGTNIATVVEPGNIVQFGGAIATTGTNPVPFVLPAGFRPATDVYVPVDLCGATNGRLFIQPNGTVTVQAEGGDFGNAQCFTSLDGASFAPSATGFTALTLINGWTNAPYSTSSAAVEEINGIVYFKGAIATSGTNAEPFVLPAAFRPAADVYVPVDLCGATNGRLFIQPNGTVTVQAEGGDFGNAQCLTSLDGARFAPTPTGFQSLTLINGWTNAPFGTSDAMVSLVGDFIPSSEGIEEVVYFKGAIASGTNAEAFVLPPWATPLTDVYVPVDLCDATKGRLFIQPNGTVTVQAEGEDFGNAQCFTSLDGVSFNRLFSPIQ